MTAHAITNLLSAMGRNGDSMMAHLSHGDVVIPREIILQNPEFLTKFKKAMEDNRSDYRGHVAGSGYENRNPHTGAPEFNWFSNAFHTVTSPIASGISNIAPIINNNPIAKLFMPGGGMSASAAPTQAAMPAPDLGSVAQPFTPKQPAATPMPFELGASSAGGQQFSTLDPMQQRSYLATQGSQGGGIGGDAKNYYLNLLQRNLIDDSGNMQNMNTALLPIEHNYLSRLGLPTDNTQNFFQALQGAS